LPDGRRHTGGRRDLPHSAGFEIAHESVADLIASPDCLGIGCDSRRDSAGFDDLQQRHLGRRFQPPIHRIAVTTAAVSFAARLLEHLAQASKATEPRMQPI
jgi:hypothetical protein